MHIISFRNFIPSCFHAPDGAECRRAAQRRRPGRPQENETIFGPPEVMASLARRIRQYFETRAQLRHAAAAMAAELAGFAEFRMSQGRIRALAAIIRKQMTPMQRAMLDHALKLAAKPDHKAGIEGIKLSRYVELLSKGKVSASACMKGIRKVHDQLASMDGKA